jgi:hypothetical protein
VTELRVSPDLALPLEAVTETDCIWAAGFFEGEGTVTIAVRNSDETYRLVVIISNTDRPLVEWFRGRWGGWLQPVYGERPGRVPAWTWAVAGPGAERFISDIGPYVRSQKKLAKLRLALRFRRAQIRPGLIKTIDRVAYKGRQRSRYREMRELNHRGVRL